MRCPTLGELPPPPVGRKGWPWTDGSPQLPDTMPDGLPWPLVSIVTPSYNQGQFIEETIRSVLLQGYPNLEYIIMDGGSTDNSVEIIRKYEPWLAYWVSEPDRGQADAINQGWSRATGDFLGWINSDDVLTLGSMALTIRYFHQNREVGFVFGDLERIDAQSQHLSFQGYKEFDLVDIVRTAGWISQPGNVFRRSVFEQVGFLDPSLHFQMDLDYWLRAGLACKFGYLPYTVARFRRHKHSKTYSQSQIAAKDIIRIYTKLFSRTDLSAELSGVRREAWANAHLYAVGAWLGSGCFRQACRELLRGCCAYPPVVFSRRFYHCLRHFAKVSVGKARSWSPAAKVGAQEH